eukprot:TRINITY_DN876_c0_g2_i1.p1 TRINITY_DN876_c0_g2~~TRINITY_DN876_c0_g2_i1.p1  ORF type:complete len:997 (+),score=297.01 TRINITY_DN876_c0_g2_i1:71-3061(+)
MGGIDEAWIPVPRSFEDELSASVLPWKDCSPSAHPLCEDFEPAAASSSSGVTLSRAESIIQASLKATAASPTPSTSSPLNDPLSQAAAEAAYDPLSGSGTALSSATAELARAASQQSAPASKPTPTSDGRADDKKKKGETTPGTGSAALDLWASKRNEILSKYTTNERVAITAKFMEETQTNVKLPADTVKERLDQLDDSAEKAQQQTMQLTQQDYIAHIERLHDELIKAWDNNKRVKALKIAIQCAKLLADTTVIQFYPSKFVLVTEILDTFGRLVFERIRRRSVSYENNKAVTLPEEFTASMVTEHARETCRNWFFKIASIRELLPRLYIELSIMRAYSFLRDNTFPGVIKRMSRMVRGLGNPLIATYARTYLARRGAEFAPSMNKYLLMMTFDHMQALKTMVDQEKIDSQVLTPHNISAVDFSDLFTPGLEWMLQQIGQHFTTKEALLGVLKKYKDTSTDGRVLNHIISAFRPNLVAQNALAMCSLIKDSDPAMFPTYKLYATLGVNLALSSPPKGKELAILNDVWKVVTKLAVPLEYITVAEVFIDYPLRNCSAREVNTLLGDIVKHVTKDKSYVDLQAQLQSIVEKVLSHNTDLDLVLKMSNFLPLVDLFTGDYKVQVNKALLASFVKNHNATSDSMLINTVFGACRICHDSLNALSFDDDVRQIARLVSAFVHKIDFGHDFEKQLNFYADCRRAFGNLDRVKHSLILAVCTLAMRTRAMVGGKHNRKTASFVRACIAFNYITIPTMEDVFRRLNLYVVAAEVALVNQSLPQADALLKSAITLVQEIPATMDVEFQVRSTEEPLVAFLQHVSALFVVLPGHPEHGPFYLVKGLVKVLSDYSWDRVSIGKSQAFLAMISAFSAAGQTKLPYHFDGVESNDHLYSGDSDYDAEVQSVISQLVGDILEQLSELNEATDVVAKKRQASLALDLFHRTASLATLNNRSAALLSKLYTLSKSSGATPQQLKQALAAVRVRSDEDSGALELVAKLSTA